MTASSTTWTSHRPTWPRSAAGAEVPQGRHSLQAPTTQVDRTAAAALTEPAGLRPRVGMGDPGSRLVVLPRVIPAYRPGVAAAPDRVSRTLGQA